MFLKIFKAVNAYFDSKAKNPDGSLNAAEQLIQSFIGDGPRVHGYKAPHAYRGTPKGERNPRKIPRSDVKAELQRLYHEGLKKPQPLKHMHRHARERAASEV